MTDRERYCRVYEDSGEDVNAGYFVSKSIRYAMTPTEDFDSESLEEIVTNVRSGKVKRSIRSQPIPTKNMGPVITVVGD